MCFTHIVNIQIRPSAMWQRKIDEDHLLTIKPMNHTLGNENKGNSQQIQPLIIREILLICVQGNVWKTVWIICVLISGCKGFIQVIV